MNSAVQKDADYKKVLKRVVDSLNEKKGENVVVLDLREIHSYLTYFVVATGNSRVHSQSLAQEAARILKEEGFAPRQNASVDSGWSVLDSFDIVVHVFLEEEREYYNLERLWSDAKKVSL